MQRAAVSIPSNIAEGYRRKSPREFLQFLSIASGSSAELETQLILASEIYGISTEDLQNDSIEIQKMLSVLFSKVKQRAEASS